MGCNESSTEKKTHSSQCFQKETEKSIHKQLDSKIQSSRTNEEDTPKDVDGKK